MVGSQEINIVCNQEHLGSEARHFTTASGPISGISVLICKMGTPADELKLVPKIKGPLSVLGVWLVIFALCVSSKSQPPAETRPAGALRCRALAVR